jgi:hypothetical protein
MSMANTFPGGDAEGLRIQLLEGFRVCVGTRLIHEAMWRRRKAASLVKLLALTPEHRLHREQVMELLWPDLDPEAAANNLHGILHVTRRVLGAARQPTTAVGYLRLQGRQLALCPTAPLWVDVEAFAAAAATARRRDTWRVRDRGTAPWREDEQTEESMAAIKHDRVPPVEGHSCPAGVSLVSPQRNQPSVERSPTAASRRNPCPETPLQRGIGQGDTSDP